MHSLRRNHLQEKTRPKKLAAKKLKVEAAMQHIHQRSCPIQDPICETSKLAEATQTHRNATRTLAQQWSQAGHTTFLNNTTFKASGRGAPQSMQGATGHQQHGRQVQRMGLNSQKRKMHDAAQPSLREWSLHIKPHARLGLHP